MVTGTTAPVALSTAPRLGRFLNNIKSIIALLRRREGLPGRPAAVIKLA
jgi:hypothetical protein